MHICHLEFKFIAFITLYPIIDKVMRVTFDLPGFHLEIVDNLPFIVYYLSQLNTIDYFITLLGIILNIVISPIFHQNVCFRMIFCYVVDTFSYLALYLLSIILMTIRMNFFWNFINTLAFFLLYIKFCIISVNLLISLFLFYTLL